MRNHIPAILSLLSVVFASGVVADDSVIDSNGTPRPLTMIVMDPLAAPLACDCVQGYAQRKYEKLGTFLEQQLDCRVDVYWAESLREAIKHKSNGKADLIIGKHSVVRHGAALERIKIKEIARLSGVDGSTMQQGLVVVRSSDTAKKLEDLKEYRFFFGPADCDEKSAAPRALLKRAGINLPTQLETFPACSTAATKLVELDGNVKAAAIISSYAQPLLEGCGAIEKGDLRVLTQTADVPFVAAFVNAELPADRTRLIENALLTVGEHASLLIALETDHGFERPPRGWPCWRGAKRDAIVERLPEALPAKSQFVWESRLPSDGVGGIAAAEGVVVVGGRDILDRQDMFRCFDQESGDMKWQFMYPAVGKLDYGNSPRATPVIANSRVFLQGAFGHIRCLDLSSGELLWSKHMAKDFGAPRMTWGYSGSPLIVENQLIIQPGGEKNSVVALRTDTGATIWSTAGSKSGYGSFALTTAGNTEQLVGFDATTLGGWDVVGGKRLWSVAPKISGDFNVQTPVIFDNQVIVSTETNGTRAYKFNNEHVLDSEANASFQHLQPDSSTPVLVDGHLYGISGGLFCLDAKNGLEEKWEYDDDAFGNYASLIGGRERFLLMTVSGELVLVKADPKACTIISRLKLKGDFADIYSHPALVGTRLFARLGKRLVRLDLPMPD